MAKTKKPGGGGVGGAVLVALVAAYLYQGGELPDVGSTSAEPAASNGIPTDYLAAYQAAAGECPALDWELLAAIGYIESRHGANMGPSSAGAIGPMQFMPATWAAYDHGDVWDIDDAAPAAAEYLCRNGLDRGDNQAAIHAYNHSWTYVANVQDQADAYRG